jgi:ketosteroid isomerase-like protein
MAGPSDFDRVLAAWRDAHHAYMKGDPEPVKAIWSHAEDVSVANPFGGAVRGWDEVRAAVDRSASTARDGSVGDFDIVAAHVATDLAYVVEIEHFSFRRNGGEDVVPFSLRATMIFRLESGVWRLLHRHADRSVTRETTGEA